MANRIADLTSRLEDDPTRDPSVDFSVSLEPICFRRNGSITDIPGRLAVIRNDTKDTLAVVSQRYTLVPHQDILNVVDRATRGLGLGPIPRGIYVDRRGARMRALFKFPALAEPVLGGDKICPCLRIQNTYDGTSRIGVHIGAFRFVCTNLAVGGGGAFAGGFLAVHAGEIPFDAIAEQLSEYLTGFTTIAGLYRHWAETILNPEERGTLLDTLPTRLAAVVQKQISGRPGTSVFDVYNASTHYATHQMRSYASAFRLLERLNRSFQECFPVRNN